MVELVDGNPAWRILYSDDVYTTRPGISHNVYMSAHSVMHTVKHGTVSGESDWHPTEELDRMSKKMTEAEILAIATE